jgi:hypothetical protein
MRFLEESKEKLRAKSALFSDMSLLVESGG